MFLKIGKPPEHDFDEPLGLLSDCHRRIEYFLAVLVAITDQLDGRSLDATRRSELQRALTYFTIAAPKHTADEEESLFPRLAASTDAEAAEALDLVRRLERDHQEADAHHRDVETLGRRWLADGTLAESDVRDQRRHLAHLSDMYRDHIAAEDHQLFPATKRLLTETALRSIGREMAARRLPISAERDRE